MGHEIVYCARCQTRILGTEITKGKAFAFSNRYCCAACVPELLKSLPHAEKAELLSALQKGRSEPLSSSSTALRAMKSSTGRVPIVDDSTRRRLAPREKKAGLALGLAAAGALALVAVVALLLAGPRASPPATSAAAPTAPPPPGGSPKSDDSLRDARDYDQRKPGDLDGRIQRWEKAVWACEGGPGLADARSGLAAALAGRKEAVARDLAPLEAEIQPLLEKESFRTALDVLESARGRHGHAEWTLAVDRKIAEARERIVTKFEAAHAEASAAKGRGEDARVRAAAERVERWGLPSYAVRMKDLLTTAPAPPAPATAPAPEANPYPAIWEKAMALASLRDYAGAATELSRGASLHPEAPGDLDAIKKAGAVPAEAREAIGRWTRGQKQSIGFFDVGGRINRVEAPFLRSEETRLHFGTGDETWVVELAELAPSTLAALYLARPKKADGDERAALVFCLVEGDLEGPKVAVGDKYWNWAKKAAADRAGGREAEARALFAAAVEDVDDPSKAVAAAGVFKDLLARFGDTPFVARNRAAIGSRTSAGRDYQILPDQLSGSGPFRLSKPAKGEAAWVSERDGEPGTVEFVYEALPNTEYRGWVYAGACCLETFEFGVQATGLRAPDPKNPKEAVAAEPGGPAWAVAKISFFLRKTHASHGGPKTASRWEWIPIPLPKSGEGGPKTVRLLSAQQGFAVAYAAVSAAPDYVPRVADVRERERARSARLRVAGPPTNAGLVGHWTFDEGQGSTAADASPRGHHGALLGASWAPGRFGGGLRFDGDNSYVELPSTPVLDGLQNGDYTLSAWFKPETAPPGKDDANDAHYGIVAKRGMHIGLMYTGSRQFHLSHYLTGDAGTGATSRSCPAGAFHHAASTFSRKTGVIRLYLDGQLENSGSFAPGTPSRDYGTERWRIGIAAPGSDRYRWAAKGVIDDVRIYDRALLPSEIRALMGPRAPGAPAPAAPAADARPWTALPLETCAGPGYRFENGVLARIPGTDNAARSPREYGDVEMRIRFEHTVSGYLFFAFRQGGDGAYVVQWNRNHLEGMEKKEHELIVICKGDAVSATLNGVPQEVERRGAPKSGAIQFNINAGADLKVKSIETRDPR